MSGLDVEDGALKMIIVIYSLAYLHKRLMELVP